MIQFDVITIFPEFFEPFITTSMIKRGIDKNILQINIHSLRDYANNKHNKVDDKPYGGGVGMILTAEPIVNAVNNIKLKNKKTLVLLTNPTKNNFFSQTHAKKYSKFDQIIIICGHYEGVDERIKELVVDETISIGEFILTGGELPAMIIIDATSRMIEGFFDKDNVLEEESYTKNNNIEHPQYTRPEIFKKLKVPTVLLSGNHKEINKWKKQNSYWAKGSILPMPVSETSVL